jgi:hypothetical protein
MRRIADHIRALVFCIADGALPSNEGRGYVVRKILRRACRDGYELGIEGAFLHGMVDLIGELMGDAYPEVREHRGQCRGLIKSEEEGFAAVYERGKLRLEEFLAGAQPGRGPMPGSGEFAFELHDTFGFPVDIKTPASLEVARNRWQNLELLTPHDQVKFVICDRADYEWSVSVLREHRIEQRCEVWFSPSFQQLAARELADWIVADRLPVRFQMQLHKLLWDDQPGH